MSATTIQPKADALTAADRCDRCGAQAYVRTRMQGDLELLWCGHHWGEHGDKMKPLAVDIHDETHKLK